MLVKELGTFLFLMAAVVTAVTVLATALWVVIRSPLQDFIEKVNATNKTLTVNGNKDPDNQTFLDRMGNVEAALFDMRLYQNEMKRQVDRIEGTVNALGAAAVADAGRLDAHEAWSAVTAARLGVPGPPAKGQE
jgi:hypothetical protein